LDFVVYNILCQNVQGVKLLADKSIW